MCGAFGGYSIERAGFGLGREGAGVDFSRPRGFSTTRMAVATNLEFGGRRSDLRLHRSDYTHLTNPDRDRNDEQQHHRLLRETKGHASAAREDWRLLRHEEMSPSSDVVRKAQRLLEPPDQIRCTSTIQPEAPPSEPPPAQVNQLLCRGDPFPSQMLGTVERKRRPSVLATDRLRAVGNVERVAAAMQAGSGVADWYAGPAVALPRAQQRRGSALSLQHDLDAQALHMHVKEAEALARARASVATKRAPPSPPRGLAPPERTYNHRYTDITSVVLDGHSSPPPPRPRPPVGLKLPLNAAHHVQTAPVATLSLASLASTQGSGLLQSSSLSGALAVVSLQAAASYDQHERITVQKDQMGLRMSASEPGLFSQVFKRQADQQVSNPPHPQHKLLPTGAPLPRRCVIQDRHMLGDGCSMRPYEKHSLHRCEVLLRPL